MSNPNGANYHKVYIFLLAIISSFGNGYWAYNLSIFNTLQTYLEDYIFPNTSTAEESLIASFLNAGAIFGAIIADPLVSKLGRRATMLWADVFGVIGLGLTIIANLPTMIVGRVISGIVGGINNVVIPMYLVEMSPLEMCGATGSLSIIILEIFAFISLVVGFAVPSAPHGGVSNQMWRILYFLPAILNIVRFFSLLAFFRTDTPFFYISKQKEEKAIEALKNIFKGDVSEEYERVKGDVIASSMEGTVGLKDLFSAKYRKGFFVSFILALLQQLCGMPAIFVFSNSIFKGSTNNTVLYSTLLGIINVIAVVISFYLIERFGRKPLLIIGTILMGSLLLAFSILVLTDGVDNQYLKFIIILWPIAFQMSAGSLTFLYISEVLSSTGVSFCIAANWAVGFLVIQFYLQVQEEVGFAAPFIFFSAFCLISAFIFWIFMVETKGKTRSEIIAEYNSIKIAEPLHSEGLGRASLPKAYIALRDEASVLSSTKKI